MNHRYASCLEQGQESFLQENVLAGADGHGGAVRQAYILVCQLPGDHILRPGDIVFLDTAAQLDAVLHADMAEMVDGQGDFITDYLTDLAHVVFQEVEALFRNVDTGERMGDILPVVAAVPPVAAFFRSLRLPCFPVQLFCLLQIPQRRIDRARLAVEDAEA